MNEEIKGSEGIRSELESEPVFRGLKGLVIPSSLYARMILSTKTGKKILYERLTKSRYEKDLN